MGWGFGVKEKAVGGDVRESQTWQGTDSGSMHVCLITKMPMKTKFLGVFSFHNSSLKN